ncbi:Protein of unknown function [Gryllus bimaculatus]|nr:Protein of unknown function [Gryllus bimaculatus]
MTKSVESRELQRRNNPQSANWLFRNTRTCPLLPPSPPPPPRAPRSQTGRERAAPSLVSSTSGSVVLFFSPPLLSQT